MEYYVFPTEAEAIGCVSYINSTPWFPIVGEVNGVPAPDHQVTTCWVESPTEMLSEEWAVPRIPEFRLDFLGVSQSDRDEFLVAFGSDIRELGSTDFPVIEEEL